MNEHRKHFIEAYEAFFGEFPSKGEGSRLWFEIMDEVRGSQIKKLMSEVSNMMGTTTTKPRIPIFKRALKQLFNKTPKQDFTKGECIMCKDGWVTHKVTGVNVAFPCSCAKGDYVRERIPERFKLDDATTQKAIKDKMGLNQ